MMKVLLFSKIQGLILFLWTTDSNTMESLTLLSHFIPNKINCNVSLKQNENKLFENFQCAFTANNADYQMQGNDAYQHESFTTQNIAQILESFYFDFFLSEDNFTNQYKYALEEVFYLKSKKMALVKICINFTNYKVKRKAQLQMKKVSGNMLKIPAY